MKLADNSPDPAGALAQAMAFRATQLGPVNRTRLGVDKPPVIEISILLEVAVKVNHTSAAGESVAPPGLHPVKEG